jgi:hypothetical protein
MGYKPMLIVFISLIIPSLGDFAWGLIPRMGKTHRWGRIGISDVCSFLRFGLCYVMFRVSF